MDSYKFNGEEKNLSKLKRKIGINLVLWEIKINLGLAPAAPRSALLALLMAPLKTPTDPDVTKVTPTLTPIDSDVKKIDPDRPRRLKSDSDVDSDRPRREPKI